MHKKGQKSTKGTERHTKIRTGSDKAAFITPKRVRGGNTDGRSCDITDRFIPQLASGSAFRAAQRLKTLDFDSTEHVLEASPSPSHLSMPGFFTDLRTTRHYNSVVPSNTQPPSSKEDASVGDFQKLYRRYVADALGFQSTERVYQFSPLEAAVAASLTKTNTIATKYSANHSRVDPLLSVLCPRLVLPYLASQAFSHSLRTRSLVPAFQRPATRAKSYTPFRVLDAPSLRNDFYSNLVSWSPKTGNIAVGLGCAVYLWSDTRGAVNVLHYSYLQLRNDFVTCVSFSPFERYLLVGTKQGRLLLYDQVEDEEPSDEGGYKPLSVSSDRSLQGICCLSINGTATQLAVGGNDNSCTIWDISDLKNPRMEFLLPHKAAVKAVAFCPWSRSLLATGGGSKDRNIRFWHTRSGTLMKETKAPGQITSLIWSLRQKQIVATFGFGDVEKPTLVSVYSYPAMTPTIEVHSSTSLRVLSAAASPDHSSICVATNDETVRFYELWNLQDCPIFEAQERGIYGSDLIEYTEGIHKNRELIR
ncbi:Ama1p [Lachancea thermotolerans CBS 6340]|uniref:KLTH0C01848p n=1 Tax=Lachancea thermotolerans (strain ATCC 56472 / CBS 6340 / NRRL Y-8284) TaxID=559295 RepID=C5DDL0_LACTC|nr:KLTH0C01848p [Lachancea thermotolerans CBS 6340]CAR21871.1 KLTH0C01848p [Lachancea thermotolerans CBS 6340]